MVRVGNDATSATASPFCRSDRRHPWRAIPWPPVGDLSGISIMLIV